MTVHSLICAQTLPGYIAKINWGKLDQVVEVYSLLQQMEAEKSLPIEVGGNYRQYIINGEYIFSFL